MGRFTRINIHAVLESSSVNGPGERLVVFFQGCSFRCRGCFNPDTHSFKVRELYSPKEVLERYLKKDVEGLTVSGGEPFLQPKGLARLLDAARSRGLSTLVYTGFTYEELLERPDCAPCLKNIDVLVAGRFDCEKPEQGMLARGSTNQRFHFLTNRYKDEDLVLPGKVEVIISADGTVRETGFSRVEV